MLREKVVDRFHGLALTSELISSGSDAGRTRGSMFAGLDKKTPSSGQKTKEVQPQHHHRLCLPVHRSHSQRSAWTAPVRLLARGKEFQRKRRSEHTFAAVRGHSNFRATQIYSHHHDSPPSNQPRQQRCPEPQIHCFDGILGFPDDCCLSETANRRVWVAQRDRVVQVNQTN